MKRNIKRLVESNIRLIGSMCYFEFGNIMAGKKCVGEWFKFNNLTENHIKALRDIFGSNMEIDTISNIYAPEIVKIVLLIKY